MQQNVLMIVIASLVLLLITLAIVLLLVWKKHLQRQAQLEGLVDCIKDDTNLRNDRIRQCLREHYHFDLKTADDLATMLFDAEKAFLFQFVEQQTEDSVEGFYENFRELTDRYLCTVAKFSNRPVREEKPLPEDRKQLKSDTSVPFETHPEPDWGDVFDE